MGKVVNRSKNYPALSRYFTWGGGPKTDLVEFRLPRYTFKLEWIHEPNRLPIMGDLPHIPTASCIRYNCDAGVVGEGSPLRRSRRVMICIGIYPAFINNARVELGGLALLFISEIIFPPMPEGGKGPPI